MQDINQSFYFVAEEFSSLFRKLGISAFPGECRNIMDNAVFTVCHTTPSKKPLDKIFSIFFNRVLLQSSPKFWTIIIALQRPSLSLAITIVLFVVSVWKAAPVN